MAAVLDISTFLVPGGVYTISMKSTGLYRPELSTVTAAIQAVPNVSAASVSLHGGVFGLFADQFDITFTYTGDGTDVVGGVAAQIMQAVNGWGASLDFVGANGGPTGVPTEGTPGAGGTDLSSLVPSQTTLIVVVIGIALVAFLASGGPSLLRGATGR